MSVASFIKDIQNSDNNRKFRWVIGLTVATVILLGGLWIITSPGGIGSTNQQIRGENQPTFFEKIQISSSQIIQTLREKTANTINYFSNKFGKANTIEVTTSNSEIQ